MSTEPSLRINAAARSFIEGFGDLVGESGLAPSIGRVMGLLLISESPTLSAEEIQKTLDLSAGAVSMATNLLVKLGWVTRTTQPGRRRYLYTFDVQSWRTVLHARLAQIDQGIALADQGLRIQPNDPRLVGMRSMYTQLYAAIKDVAI